MKLLALDIDDTLTGADGRISPRNLAAISCARAAGVAVTLITGRRYLTSAELAARDLGLQGPIACHYGRAIVRHPEADFLSEHLLPRGLCARVLELAAERGLLPSICADEVFYWPPAVEAGMGGRKYPLVKVVPDLGPVVEEQGDRIISMAVSGRNASEVRAILEEEYGDRISVYTQPVAGGDRSIEVILDGATDKGTALLEICALMGIDPRETVAMGDSEADIPLLRAAGLSVAMPWSPPSVRRASGRVAEGRPEDAAARAIEELLGQAWR